MGLDLYLQDVEFDPKHSAHWAYSGFAHFRKRLAKDGLGIDLDEMEGFAGPDRTPKPWSTIGNDALVPFLDHSDCDGQLAPDVCARVAPRIKEIVGKWDPNDYDRQEAEKLVELMMDAVSTRKALVFA